MTINLPNTPRHAPETAQNCKEPQDYRLIQLTVTELPAQVTLQISRSLNVTVRGTEQSTLQFLQVSGLRVNEQFVDRADRHILNEP